MTRLKTARETVLVPLAREKSGHVTVLATLSGQDARLILDTGAGGTCIDASALGGYGLRAGGRSKQGGGVGSAAMRMTHVAGHDLSLAGVDLAAFKLIALDLSHVIAGLAKAKVHGIVGVLGADVLHRKQAVIDYARGVLLLAR